MAVMADIETVAVIGVGTMGEAMVGHIDEGGYDVYAYDVDCEKAKEAVESRATVTDTLERAVRPAEMIIIAVGTYEQAKSVVYDTGGILESATAGDVVAISSTLSPGQCISLSEDLRDEEIEPIGAPTCRGEKAARRGDLLVFVGSDRSVYDKARLVLEQFSSPENVVHLGPVGSGQAAKAANNALLWSSVVANQEVLLLAEAYELDLDLVRELLQKSTGSNWALGGWDWMHTKWAHKDMDIISDMAKRQDVRIPSLALTEQLVQEIDQDELDRTR
ncbi:NAD(P)-dependent oxidoreductase [Natrialba swarupiae]|uniref:NAD(P)-dependent oxidoreductase n=2 Tax=Natrialba swarupiae TaxID=2448032 RepID=A0A5D5ANP6_9EURY|nr:NAD(P)-dependent oxidoreductase [Natrialba swarupiae]